MRAGSIFPVLIFALSAIFIPITKISAEPTNDRFEIIASVRYDDIRLDKSVIPP